MSHRLYVDTTTQLAQRGIAARLDADREGLSPFGRVAYARDFEIVLDDDEQIRILGHIMLIGRASQLYQALED